MPDIANGINRNDTREERLPSPRRRLRNRRKDQVNEDDRHRIWTELNGRCLCPEEENAAARHLLIHGGELSHNEALFYATSIVKARQRQRLRQTRAREEWKIKVHSNFLPKEKSRLPGVVDEPWLHPESETRDFNRKNMYLRTLRRQEKKLREGVQAQNAPFWRDPDEFSAEPATGGSFRHEHLRQGTGGTGGGHVRVRRVSTPAAVGTCFAILAIAMYASSFRTAQAEIAPGFNRLRFATVSDPQGDTGSLFQPNLLDQDQAGHQFRNKRGREPGPSDPNLFKPEDYPQQETTTPAPVVREEGIYVITTTWDGYVTSKVKDEQGKKETVISEQPTGGFDVTRPPVSKPAGPREGKDLQEGGGLGQEQDEAGEPTERGEREDLPRRSRMDQGTDEATTNFPVENEAGSVLSEVRVEPEATVREVNPDEPLTADLPEPPPPKQNRVFRKEGYTADLSSSIFNDIRNEKRGSIGRRKRSVGVNNQELTFEAYDCSFPLNVTTLVAGEPPPCLEDVAVRSHERDEYILLQEADYTEFYANWAMAKTTTMVYVCSPSNDHSTINAHEWDFSVITKITSGDMRDIFREPSVYRPPFHRTGWDVTLNTTQRFAVNTVGSEYCTQGGTPMGSDIDCKGGSYHFKRLNLFGKTREKGMIGSTNHIVVKHVELTTRRVRMTVSREGKVISHNNGFP